MAVIRRVNNWFEDPNALKEFNNIVDQWNQHNSGSATWDRCIFKGTPTNDNAAAGTVGETIEATATDQNCAASGVGFNAATISLTAGDWLVSGIIEYKRNGATFSAVNPYLAISPTSGNSFVGEVEGINAIYRAGTGIATAFTSVDATIPSYRVSLSASASYYLKGSIDSYTSGTPKYSGRITAVRIR